MGVSQKILKVRQPKIISTQFFLAEDFDVIFFHNMLNWYKFAEKNGIYCWTTQCHVAAVKVWANFDL
jgi:hypothetical protein